MEIQSLSICVPTKGCVNNCKFCVSRMHENEYKNFYNKIEIKKRMQFARDNDCNTLIFTGTGEPLQNKHYLKKIAEINNELPSPFVWIEFQTSGVMLDLENLNFLKEIGITTISLSLANIFNSDRNAEICQMSKSLKFDIPTVCKKIKNLNFNLRISLNMTSDYNNFKPEEIFNACEELGADQITFRELYTADENSEQSQWVQKHKMDSDAFNMLREFIILHGKKLEILPFGAIKYSYKEMSTVIDSDCMAEDVKFALKYLILRENKKLYSRWDDKGSLIF